MATKLCRSPANIFLFKSFALRSIRIGLAVVGRCSLVVVGRCSQLVVGGRRWPLVAVGRSWPLVLGGCWSVFVVRWPNDGETVCWWLDCVFVGRCWPLLAIGCWWSLLAVGGRWSLVAVGRCWPFGGQMMARLCVAGCIPVFMYGAICTSEIRPQYFFFGMAIF